MLSQTLSGTDSQRYCDRRIYFLASTSVVDIWLIHHKLFPHLLNASIQPFALFVRLNFAFLFVQVLFAELQAPIQGQGKNGTC